MINRTRLRFPTLLTLLVVAAAVGVAGCGGSGSSTSTSSTSKVAPGDHSVAGIAQRQVDGATQTLKKHNTDTQALRNLGTAYMTLAAPSTYNGKPQKDRGKYLGLAISTFEKLVKLTHNDRTSVDSLVDAYFQHGDYPKAEILMKQIVQKNPRDPNAWYRLGLASSNGSDLSGALTAYRKFVQLADKKDPRIKQIQQIITALEKAAKSK
jgi:Flp pilus assembly protein TadD